MNENKKMSAQEIIKFIADSKKVTPVKIYLREKSEIDFKVELTNVKQIITLSTCHNNNVDRLVVHAYLVNE